jgi:hypothetical protein
VSFNVITRSNHNLKRCKQKEELLAQKKLKELLEYNPETGVFTRLTHRNNNAKIGDIAGSKGKNGYVIIYIDGIGYPAHRLAWLYMYGEWPKYHLDHIDHVRHHNMISNLREADVYKNQKNRTINKNNSSGYTGVSWYKLTNRWVAQIRVNNKILNLGYFLDKSEAIKAREEANVKYGYHENHGCHAQKRVG